MQLTLSTLPAKHTAQNKHSLTTMLLNYIPDTAQFQLVEIFGICDIVAWAALWEIERKKIYEAFCFVLV